MGNCGSSKFDDERCLLMKESASFRSLPTDVELEAKLQYEQLKSKCDDRLDRLRVRCKPGGNNDTQMEQAVDDDEIQRDRTKKGLKAWMSDEPNMVVRLWNNFVRKHLSPWILGDPSGAMSTYTTLSNIRDPSSRKVEQQSLGLDLATLTVYWRVCDRNPVYVAEREDPRNEEFSMDDAHYTYDAKHSMNQVRRAMRLNTAVKQRMMIWNVDVAPQYAKRIRQTVCDRSLSMRRKRVRNLLHSMLAEARARYWNKVTGAYGPAAMLEADDWDREYVRMNRRLEAPRELAEWMDVA